MKQRKDSIAVATRITRSSNPQLYDTVEQWKNQNQRGLVSQNLILALESFTSDSRFDTLVLSQLEETERMKQIVKTTIMAILPTLSGQISSQVIEHLQRDGVMISAEQRARAQRFGSPSETDSVNYTNSVSSMLDDILGD